MKNKTPFEMQMFGKPPIYLQVDKFQNSQYRNMEHLETKSLIFIILRKFLALSEHLCYH